MSQLRTLGELKRAGARPSSGVKDEMRRNLLAKLSSGAKLFPGILGYNESVVPRVVNAVLSRHNMILLGLRGQAKSRLLRSLTTLLDPLLATIAGCEIHDDPFQPLCRRCRDLVDERQDATEIAYLTPEERYVEKLATPDVTIADVIGDVDPIRAARGGHDLASELTIPLSSPVSGHRRSQGREQRGAVPLGQERADSRHFRQRCRIRGRFDGEPDERFAVEQWATPHPLSRAYGGQEPSEPGCGRPWQSR